MPSRATTLTPQRPVPEGAVERLVERLESDHASRAEVLAALRGVPDFARSLERLGAGLRRGGSRGGGLEAAVLYLGQTRLMQRLVDWCATEAPTSSRR